MFGLQKYAQKLYDIKWKFDETKLDDIEHMLYVKFKKENDYFMLETILYTYVDILLGLEDCDFDFIKQNDDYILKINKI